MVHIDFILSYFQLYLTIINIFAFILYGYDKSQALKTYKNISRVSENKLLFFTFIGGTLGSLSAMFLFRHKIKKKSFIIKFALIVLTQILLVYFYLEHM